MQNCYNTKEVVQNFWITGFAKIWNSRPMYGFSPSKRVWTHLGCNPTTETFFIPLRLSFFILENCQTTCWLVMMENLVWVLHVKTSKVGYKKIWNTSMSKIHMRDDVECKLWNFPFTSFANWSKRELLCWGPTLHHNGDDEIEDSHHGGAQDMPHDEDGANAGAQNDAQRHADHTGHKRWNQKGRLWQGVPTFQLPDWGAKLWWWCRLMGGVRLLLKLFESLRHSAAGPQSHFLSQTAGLEGQTRQNQFTTMLVWWGHDTLESPFKAMCSSDGKNDDKVQQMTGKSFGVRGLHISTKNLKLIMCERINKLTRLAIDHFFTSKWWFANNCW